MNRDRLKHYTYTTAKFAVQQVPFLGTAVEVPRYISDMQKPDVVQQLNNSKVKNIRFVVKSRKFMGEYIALNWLEPREAKKFGIKKNQVFVREDWWVNPAKRVRVEVHEKVEIYLRLNFGYDYETAHKLATKAEHDEIKRLGWKLDRAIIRHR